MRPRTLCALLAAALAGALIVSPCSHAAYLEDDANIDRVEPGPPTPPPPPPPPPPPAPPAPPRVRDHAIRALLERVRIDDPMYYAGLTVYPLHVHGGGGSSGVHTLDEALARGWLRVEEQQRADVGRVWVENLSGTFVLAVTGEMLTGGKQNRLVRDDVLLAPRSGRIPVAVYCGEQHRWSDRRHPFEPAGALAAPGLRSRAARDAEQGAIWREIDETAKRAGVRSPTHDYQALFRNDRIRDKLEDYAHRFRRLRRSRTVGLVAVAGGRVLGADLFGDARLLQAYWDKLLRSYSLEVLDRGYGEHRDGARAVRRYLDGALRASCRQVATPGAGSLWKLRGETDGAGLVWNGRALHVHLLEAPTAHPPPPPPPVPHPPIVPFPGLER